ncbi:MAG: glycine--tRNA ligase subunit beta [Proteobacteria bacterium]|nr:glycine--tRNA ligase subunit beta [Pseudomonadota bacterium]
MSAKHSDFLVEIGTEELPPKALLSLQQALAAGVTAGLQKTALTHGPVLAFATPRRLAVRVRRLLLQQPQQQIRRKGPPVAAAFDSQGQPTRAALAFAASCGATLETLQQLEEGKGRFLFFVGTRPGETAASLLPQIVQAALDALPIPRRMRWGAGEAQFVRPVHWIVMLLGREVVPATLLETPSGKITRGHRFMAPRPLTLTSPAAYERTLLRGYVLADFAQRRERIREQVTAAAIAAGGRALIGEALLDEVAALTEWPVALVGRFEERFLALPREVLISTLQDHQRYFAVEDGQGRLKACFIAVSNIESREPDKVRAGNERVVRPRLADAAFFWDQDRRVPLAARVGGLDAVTFQAKLGSLGDKTRRVVTLARWIAAALGSAAGEGLDAQVARAATLCKCDLLTAMVGEFPELQGIMGSHYARADGEAAAVADAIREHYLPRSAADTLPATVAGAVLAVADRLDTLAGIFVIGEKPTGNKDPFGLRRAALGVQRILIEKDLGADLDLTQAIGQAVELVQADIAKTAAMPAAIGTDRAAAQPARTPRSAAVVRPAAELVAEIYDFLYERLRAYNLESPAAAAGETPALTVEMFEAVLATRPASPQDFQRRLRALQTFLGLPEAATLIAANKRIANILRKVDTAAPAEVEVGLLRETAEIRLFDAVRALRDSVSAATARHEYAAALGQLAQLRPAVDTFFTDVMVMAEDPRLRGNRLALLARLQALFAAIADLSRLPG